MGMYKSYRESVSDSTKIKDLRWTVRQDYRGSRLSYNGRTWSRAISINNDGPSLAYGAESFFYQKR